MKNKFKEHACEFKNEAECEEELDEEELDYEKEEKSALDEEEQQTRKEDEERDEDKFEDLKKKGIDEKEAAHIINRETKKHLDSGR